MSAVGEFDSCTDSVIFFCSALSLPGGESNPRPKSRTESLTDILRCIHTCAKDKTTDRLPRLASRG